MLNSLFRRSPTAASSHVSSSRLDYLPGLDGLRALAVLAVLLYHADVLWLPGGFLGVEIFFVVSGYLITSLLLSEYRANNKVNLLQFWQRRARRLLPALFAMILAVLVFAVIFLPEEVASLRGDVVAAFIYITNWYLIVAEQSYFEFSGRPSLLQHLWSLAVEEQFYLAWPLIFAFLLTRLKTRGAMILLMVGAAVSALLMGILYTPDADPSRVYYGTDTRAAGLLLGGALAFVWMPQANGQAPSRTRRWLLDGVGVAALAGLAIACLWMSEFDPFLYQGGMLLVAAGTALVIAAVAAPHSPLFASVLGFGVLRWIGLRSYSLYLWHWPVYMVTRPQLDTTLEGTPLLIVRLALTFALAEISFRVIESPFRRGALGKAWHSWNTAQGARRWGLGFVGAGAVGAAVVGLVVLGSLVWNAQAPAEPDWILMTAEEEAGSWETALSEEEQAGPTAMESSASSEMLPVSMLLGDPENPVDEWQDAVILPLPENVDPAAALPAAALASLYHAPRLESVIDLPDVAVTKSSGCDARCVARQELLEMKQGVIRPAGPIKRPVPPTVVMAFDLDRAFAREAAPVKPVEPPAQNAASAAGIEPPHTGPAQVFALGDSVMLGASNYLRKTITAMDVDAKLGRQVSTALKLIQARKDANALAPVVVVHLGNNGTFTAKQFDEMMTLLADVPRVIFLTNKVPRKWQEPNNYAMSEGVKKYPNAVLVDWNALSSQHPEWFWKDGIHLRPEGAQVYADLIAGTLVAPTQ
jgi:peptidoglycan/LPS O-acetylase OafA/YrhL